MDHVVDWILNSSYTIQCKLATDSDIHIHESLTGLQMASPPLEKQTASCKLPQTGW